MAEWFVNVINIFVYEGRQAKLLLMLLAFFFKFSS